jgi:uncharacterized protein
MTQHLEPIDRKSTRFLEKLQKVLFSLVRKFCFPWSASLFVCCLDGAGAYDRGVLIRDIADSDLPALLKINNDNVPAVGEVDAARLAAITAESTIAIVAEDENGVLAGFCLVLSPGMTYDSSNYVWFSENYTDFIYLDRVAVAETHRSHGIGAELYREVERRAAAEWFLLEVNTRPRNDGSLRFHTREGFVEVLERETPYGFAVSMMAKRLR